MKIEERLISSILPYARNPRRNDQAINKVASSIKEFGFRQPIVVDKDGTVVAGHTRLEAAYKLGLKSVPVHVAEDLTEIQAKAYRIADNRVAQESEWDIDLLRLEMEELKDEIDLDLTGFDESELDKILVEAIEGLTDPDEVPQVDEDPVTEPGDLIELGSHRLLCGDSTEYKDLEKLMNGAKAEMVFTDPPYGVGYDGGIQFSNDGVKRGQREKIENDHSDEIFSIVIPLIADICIGPCYVWFAGTKASKLYNAVEQVGDIHSLLIWEKNGGYGALNANYKQKHEPCLYWKPKGKKLNFVGASTETTIWNIKKDGINKLHPTQKPVELSERAIRNHSVGLIADLFLGSGSTLIACEKTNRKCYGMELNPQYCDVIITRWSNFTGKDEVTINGKPVSWKKHQLEKAA